MIEVPCRGIYLKLIHFKLEILQRNTKEERKQKNIRMLHLDFGDTLPELGPESLDQLSDPENVNENEDIRNLSRNSGGDEVQSPHLNANKACTQNSSDLDTTIPVSRILFSLNILF